MQLSWSLIVSHNLVMNLCNKTTSGFYTQHKELDPAQSDSLMQWGNYSWKRTRISVAKITPLHLISPQIKHWRIYFTKTIRFGPAFLLQILDCRGEYLWLFLSSGKRIAQIGLTNIFFGARPSKIVWLDHTYAYIIHLLHTRRIV